MLNSKETRRLVKEAAVIPGRKSLHRGIHYHQNTDATTRYRANPTGQRSDHKELLVHHQKINAELQEVYARTAALDKDNMTMEQRIEQSWKDAERIGVKRPQSKVGFAAHLQKVSSEKKDERQRGHVEYTTSGETTDYSKGSAIHNAKDRRIKLYQKKQLKRAHMLQRYGDPTPLKQSGKFDDRSATLNVFQKTIRRVKRDVANDAKLREVKTTKRGRSMWDVRGSDDNINRPSSHIVRSTKDFDLPGQRPQKKRRMER